MCTEQMLEKTSPIKKKQAHRDAKNTMWVNIGQHTRSVEGDAVADITPPKEQLKTHLERSQPGLRSTKLASRTDATGRLEGRHSTNLRSNASVCGQDDLPRPPSQPHGENTIFGLPITCQGNRKTKHVVRKYQNLLNLNVATNSQAAS